MHNSIYTIYTIGHGSRRPEELLDLLKRYEIAYLVDVRSQPYSRFNPSFNREDLTFFLQENGVQYLFMGESLGGRPADLACYVDGKIDYEIVMTKEVFLEGIQRLKTAHHKKLKVALMCSETDPCECHRSKLIGRALESEGIDLQHIDERGRLKDQRRVINDMNRGRSDVDLFGNQINTTSRKAYL